MEYTKQTLLSCIKASKSKQPNEIAKSLGMDLEYFKSKLTEFDLWDYVVSVCLPEKELQQYLPNFHKDRKVIYPYEIDFYNDTLKLGIEFNGSHWHSSEFKSRYYHQEKSQMAWSNGIKLYHIYEYEWNERNKPIIMQHIRRLGNNLVKVYDYELIELDRNSTENFLHFNNITYDKNYDNSLGLVKDDVLAVITIKDNRVTNYTEKLDREIVGGLKCLFKNAMEKFNVNEIEVDFAKYLYNFTEIFNIDKCTEPQLIWFNSNGKLSEEKKEYLLAGNNKLSEEQYLKKLGYHKLYDCGKIKLIK